MRRFASPAAPPQAQGAAARCSSAHRASAPALTIGELKARHREDHLCVKCGHHLVCGMANALDPNLLVTITNCLGFEPDDGEDPQRVCELTPIEPLAIS